MAQGINRGIVKVAQIRKISEKANRILTEKRGVAYRFKRKVLMTAIGPVKRDKILAGS
jgi:hypothetical protein